MSEINPYQPPLSHFGSDGDSTVMTFDGQITEADYVSLMPERRVLFWVLLVVMVLLVPLVIVFAAMSVTAFMQSGFGVETFVSGLGGLFIAAICVVSVRTMGAKSRGRRALRRHRDLLCVARGRLSRHGLVLFHGTSTFWLAPSELAGASVSSGGIRIPIDQKPFRFFALVPRLFDQFSLASAKQLKRGWLEQAATSAEDDWLADPFGTQLGAPWSKEEYSSSSNVPFTGAVTAQFPLKSPELLARCKVETLSIVFWFCVAMLSLFFGRPLGVVVCGGLVMLSIYNFVQHWRQYHHGVRTDHWNQAGWIGKESFAWRNEKRAVYLNANQIIQGSVTDELATLYEPAGNVFFIPRDHVADEAGWKKIADQIPPVA